MVKRFLKKQIKRAGYDVVKLNKEQQWPADFETDHKRIAQKVAPFTMTSPERVFGLIESVKYITKHGIEGDIVECGVWKGGSMLAIAEALKDAGVQNRKLYLYDTFEGMSEPTEADRSHDDQDAVNLLQKDTNKEKNLVWAYSTLDTVKKTMQLSAYPQELITYVKGKVEETLPRTLPGKIALLRLDTDWYESTKHELEQLYPLLVPGGILIIDDYGFWKGARKAVDEYIAQHSLRLFLARMDDTGRIAVKP